MKNAEQVSAGGLVVEDGKVLLISTQNGRRWQLPKGRLEPGETAAQAAVREVREETGVTGTIVSTLPTVEYWFMERELGRIHKWVHYFLLHYVEGSCENFDPNEVSGAAWVHWDEALARLTFDNERNVVRAAREQLASEAATASGS